MDQRISTSNLPRLVQVEQVFIFIFGFIAGVLVSSFVFIAPLVSVLILIVASSILVLEKIQNKRIGKEVLFLSLVLFSFGLGTLRYAIKDFHEPLIPLPSGIVVNEPEQRENTTRFVMRADNGEKVLVTTDLYSSVQYGDSVKVDGKLGEPGVIDDGVGRPFDYAAYLAKDDVYYTSSFASVEIVSSGHGNPLKEALFKLKHSLIGKIREILPEPESSLLAGLVLAGKAAMPKDVLEEFRLAGVIHIVVLSGYNIVIIADFLRKMFENFFLMIRRGGPRIAAGVSIVGIILFVLMTGAEATVVRASLMVLTVIAAKMFGRTYSAPRALLLAATLMVLHNPKILVFDPSFQLSFLATCALIYIVPIFEKYLKLVPFIPRRLSGVGEKLGLRTIIATTSATQLTVLPLLIYSMGDFSLVSLPSNILILFFIPITMLVGFIATLLSYFSIIVALPFSYLAHLLLSWILWVSSFFGSLSFASVSAPNFPFWAVLVLYLLIIIFVWRSRGSPQRSSS